MKTSSKVVHFLLAFVASTQITFASSSGFTTLVRDYQFAVTVEWDQKDQAFLQSAEVEFTKGVEKLLNEGTSSQDLLNESLALIPDQNSRKELAESIRMYQNGKMSAKELLGFIDHHSAEMRAKGTSWSPALKVVVGLVGAYAIFKLVQIIILYWDTDPNYGQSGQY